MITVYGIQTCDSCRKARRWLKNNDVQHRFHDLRKDGLDPDTLRGWIERVGWEPLLNRRSTTWRNLDESRRTDLDARSAAALMAANPTLVKRPVLEAGDKLLVGFAESDYQNLL
jgi:Spx/MgsR family transcriptional regulator